MQKDHRDSITKYARIKLEWKTADLLSITSLKTKLKAESIFAMDNGDTKSAVCNFE